MTTSTVTPQIAEFAAAVRTALADLPAEERDELTDGLEADLSESLAEDLRRTLPDPVAYAAELRAAAGLPVRARQRGTFAGLTQGWHDTRADVGIAIRRNPALGGALDFAITLRPAWWLARAWVAVWLLSAFFGQERGLVPAGGWILVLVAAVIISVQWGRGRWLPRSGLPWLIGIGNVIALVLIVPTLAAIGSTAGPDTAIGSVYPPGGAAIDGEQVQNVFAYDADGNPLHDVQLFDQSGRPLDVGTGTRGPECNADCTTDLVRLPRVLDNGKAVWNVFPLREAAVEQATRDDRTGDYVLNGGEKSRDAMPPFVKVPALVIPQKVAKSND